MLKRVIVALALATGATLVHATDVAVYKSPTCGCCSKWVEHMQANGFNVAANNVRDTVTYKLQGGIAPAYASCHTAFVDGYVIEGHVPATDIRRLLAERPDARGLAVPAMPVGSPGMEQGARKDPYKVYLIHQDGSSSVFTQH